MIDPSSYAYTCCRDWPCLPQRDTEGYRSKEEEALFKKALEAIVSSYASVKGTAVLQVRDTSVPTSKAAATDAHGPYNTTPYENRGWVRGMMGTRTLGVCIAHAHETTYSYFSLCGRGLPLHAWSLPPNHNNTRPSHSPNPRLRPDPPGFAPAVCAAVRTGARHVRGSRRPPDLGEA